MGETRFAGSLAFASILSQHEHQLELNRSTLCCLFDRFVSLIDNRAAVICSFVTGASFCKFDDRGGGTPKIALPRPRNGAAQIL
jgi:hypothetical protein